MNINEVKEDSKNSMIIAICGKALSSKTTSLIKLMNGKGIIITDKYCKFDGIFKEDIKSVKVLIINSFDALKIEKIIDEYNLKNIGLDLSGISIPENAENLAKIIKSYPNKRFIISIQCMKDHKFKINENIKNYILSLADKIYNCNGLSIEEINILD